MSEPTTNDINTILANFPVKDSSSNKPLNLRSHELLPASRVDIYARKFPRLSSGVAVSATYENEDKEVLEYIVHIDPKTKAPTLILQECSIFLEEFPPSQIVEYSFQPNGPWLLSNCCVNAVEMYRQHKFSKWRELFDHASCEAALRRLLKIGLIARLYDESAFPELEEDKASWQVTDERTGKLVHIPHPVHALRRWDTTSQAYVEVPCRLEGAPSDADVDQYWAKLLEELYRLYGKEYIEGLMSSAT